LAALIAPRRKTFMPNLTLPPCAAPVIETARLRLRAHRIEDFDASAAMWGDPVVTHFIGGKPSTREEVWGRLLRYAGLWALLGYGYWAVEDKADGQFVGDIGFAEFKRDITPSMEGFPEIGWVLSPRIHGRGYATEAVAAALAWGDAHFGATPSVCIIDPENLASIGVAQKSGFREIARADYRGPTVMYRREAPAQ
jgi:RimJ/RimL family protein N-acetyltransferase